MNPGKIMHFEGALGGQASKSKKFHELAVPSISVLRAQRASERSELSARSDEKRQSVVASDKKQRQATTCGDKQRPAFLL